MSGRLFHIQWMKITLRKANSLQSASAARPPVRDTVSGRPLLPHNRKYLHPHSPADFSISHIWSPYPPRCCRLDAPLLSMLENEVFMVKWAEIIKPKCDHSHFPLPPQRPRPGDCTERHNKQLVDQILHKNAARNSKTAKIKRTSAGGQVSRFSRRMVF